MLVPVDKLIPQSNIVVFSPHYDDVLFFLGGYFDGLKKIDQLRDKQIHVCLLFSRSNYQARDDAGNRQTDLKRIQFASGVRLQEDMNCLDELLGQDGYRYELHGYPECFVRGKAFADSEMEFPHGMYDDFDDADHALFERIQRLITTWIEQPDTALVFPTAIKEHIDHFLLREAAIKVAAENPGHAAEVYFIEDKPYGGLATEEELSRLESFVSDDNLEPMPFAYDPEVMLALAFKHYVSQVEDCYRTGVLDRAALLKQQFQADAEGVDRLFRLPGQKGTPSSV